VLGEGGRAWATGFSARCVDDGNAKGAALMSEGAGVGGGILGGRMDVEDANGAGAGGGRVREGGERGHGWWSTLFS
jgi:hypothetical protein